MADLAGNSQSIAQESTQPGVPLSVDEARAFARQRFKERLEAGAKIGNCECHDLEPGEELDPTNPNARRVAGVRFIDSGQVYYFDPAGLELAHGDWIVVETSRGREAARVVIAPHQVLANQLKGELKPVERRLTEIDVQQMEQFRRDSAVALKTFGAKVRERGLPMKPISADYNFDGTEIAFSFSAPERVDFRDLARELGTTLKCRVELKQVGPRDEARLLGGLGRCGRTLCCSTWLPMFPEVSMGMAKTQDLALNPSKVSGVCGRLLCCLSYENEQYKQMKAVMPKLGQKTATPRGEGTVIALHILKDQVTVLLDDENVEVTFPAGELGFGTVTPPLARPAAPPVLAQETSPGVNEVTAPEASATEHVGGGRRRRRRRGRGHSNASVGTA